MPAPPDFDQIALRIGEAAGYSGHGAITSEIVEQLRQVWNARGAADIAAIDATMPYTSDGVFIGLRHQVVRAIQGADR